MLNPPPSKPGTAKASRQAKRIVMYRAIALALASILFLGAGLIGLFFDNATAYEAILYWTGLLIAVIVMVATAFNPWAGLVAGLVELVVCFLLASSMLGSPFRVLALPTFPLVGIVVITALANVVVLIDSPGRGAQVS